MNYKGPIKNNSKLDFLLHRFPLPSHSLKKSRDSGTYLNQFPFEKK